jgi:hypothetical protein
VSYCYTEGWPRLRIVIDLSALLHKVQRCLMTGRIFNRGQEMKGGKGEEVEKTMNF